MKPDLRGVVSVAHFITGHVQTQSNRVCYFLFFDVFLASKEYNYLELELIYAWKTILAKKKIKRLASLEKKCLAL